MNKINLIIVMLFVCCKINAKAQDIIITGAMFNPAGANAGPKGFTETGTESGSYTWRGGMQYAQFMATKDINFEQTPYAVIFRAGEAGSTLSTYRGSWIEGGSVTFKFKLDSGSVKKGEFFYVGGTDKYIGGYRQNSMVLSTDISDRYWKSIAYCVKDGIPTWMKDITASKVVGDDGIGNSTLSIFGYLNPTSAVDYPNGIAVFSEGTTLNPVLVNENTTPVDAIFFSNEAFSNVPSQQLTTIGNINAVYKSSNPYGYKMPDNDRYNSADLMGTGSNMFAFSGPPDNKEGWFLKLGGVYDATSSTWLTPRSTQYVKVAYRDTDEEIAMGTFSMIEDDYSATLSRYTSLTKAAPYRTAVTALSSFNYSSIKAHPRLLFTKDEELELKNKILLIPELASIHNHILSKCEILLDEDPLTMIVTGGKMLDISRQAVQRIFYLSYAFRMTDDTRYLVRAEQEINAVCSFPDWNPVHFLDVGEMAAAVSIGYDWLFDNLSSSTKTNILNALKNKAIQASYNQNNNSWFLASEANWNQVCNTGLLYAALVTYEENTSESIKVIERALKSIKLPLSQYAPSGNYSEGYGYWGYGTTYQVLFLEALTAAFGTDKDLYESPGFMQTAEYILYMGSPVGRIFNYADNGLVETPSPAMLWFATKSNNPDLLFNEFKMMRDGRYLESFGEDRFLPISLIFGMNHDFNYTPSPSTKKMYVGYGKVPVALIRPTWNDRNGIYVGIKGGPANAPHGHMDSGSFVYESDGVRWALDLGKENYYNLESNNVDLWNNNQNSPRYDIIRIGNKYHNTLTINDNRHNVGGKGEIVEVYDTYAERGVKLDLTEVLNNEISEAKRKIVLVNEDYLSITDNIKTNNNQALLRWSMITEATPEIIDNETIKLNQGNKVIFVKATSNSLVQPKIWSTIPPNSYEAQNYGLLVIGFETLLDANQDHTFDVKIGKTVNNTPVSTQFTKDNIVVLVAGDGSTSNLPEERRTNVLSLVEYTPNGNRVIGGIVGLPKFNDGNQLRIVSPLDRESYFGQLSLSPDGSTLSLIGYNLTPHGKSNFTNNTNRVLGLINSNRQVNSSHFIQNNAFGAPTQAIVNNGYTYIAGTTGGLGALKLQDNSLLSISSTNPRAIGIFNNQLYASSTVSQRYLYTAGTGVPTSGSQLESLVFGIHGSIHNPYQFVFLDIDNNSSPDLLYVIENDLIRKYIFNTQTVKWLLKGEYSKVGLRGLTGKYSSTEGVVLYGTTNSQLIKFKDNANPLTADLSIVETVLANAEPNTAFKGVAFAPYEGVLSLSKISLNAKQINNYVELKAEIFTDNQGYNFELSRSSNGKVFKTLNTFQTNPGINNFSYTDEFPYTGKSYYKLRQVGLDGKSTELSIASVNVLGRSPELILSNLDDNLNINAYSPVSSSGELIISDILGRTAYKQSILLQAGSNLFNINLSGVPNGMYIVKITSKEKILTGKFLK